MEKPFYHLVIIFFLISLVVKKIHYFTICKEELQGENRIRWSMSFCDKILDIMQKFFQVFGGHCPRGKFMLSQKCSYKYGDFEEVFPFRSIGKLRVIVLGI